MGKNGSNPPLNWKKNSDPPLDKIRSALTGYIHLNLLFFIVYTPWPKRRNKKKAKVITRWIITGFSTGLKIWKMIYRKNRSKKYLWNILIYFQVYVYLKSSNTFLEHNLSSEYFSYFPPLTWIYNVLLQQFSNLGNKFALVLTVEKVKLRGKLRCFLFKQSVTIQKR